MEKKTFYLTCERTWVYDTLIFAAGILGSYTYMLCGGIFCNAQTGNIVLLGIALGTRSWTSALYYVIPISAYALGAFISELIPDDVKHRFHIRWETILVAVEIVFVAVLGALPASTPVQVFQVSINFIASMQYNTFRNSEGVPMATTFATNHVRQLGIGLAKELHRRHGDTSHRRVLKRHFSMVLFFLAGTILGAVACIFLGRRAVWVAALPTPSFSLPFSTPTSPRKKSGWSTIPRDTEQRRTFLLLSGSFRAIMR